MEVQFSEEDTAERVDNQGRMLVNNVISNEHLTVDESAIGVLNQVRLDLRLAPIRQRGAEEIAKCLFFCEAFFEKEKQVGSGQEKPLSEGTPVILTCLEKVPGESWPDKSGYFSITGVVLHAHDDRLEIECTPYTQFIASYEPTEPSSAVELLEGYGQPNEPVEVEAEVPEEVQEPALV